jgi:hypothetical protein
VLSPNRITLENNGNIRPQPDRQKRFSGASGGGNVTGIEPSLPRKALKMLVGPLHREVNRWFIDEKQTSQLIKNASTACHIDACGLQDGFMTSYSVSSVDKVIAA